MQRYVVFRYVVSSGGKKIKLKKVAAYDMPVAVAVLCYGGVTGMFVTGAVVCEVPVWRACPSGR